VMYKIVGGRPHSGLRFRRQGSISVMTSLAVVACIVSARRWPSDLVRRTEAQYRSRAGEIIAAVAGVDLLQCSYLLLRASLGA
jgi:hypothetical protein